MRRALLLGATTLAAAAPAAAAPYSFLLAPTDQIGVPGYAAATEITPEGYLYTGSAEIVFRYGPHLRAWNVRNRSLADGRYPILHSARADGKLRYSLTTFTAAVAGGPVDFVRVRIHNNGRRSARAGWAIATRWSGGAKKPNGVRRFRFMRPATPSRTGLYYQPGYGWDPGSTYAFKGRAFTRDGRALYLAPRAPRGFGVGHHRGRRHPQQTTVVGTTNYRGRIRPGRTVTLDFVVPVVPADRASGAYTQIAHAPFDHYEARALGTWRRLLGRAMDVEVPEQKVVDTFYASVMWAAMSRYVADGQWVQAVNDLQYHAFWLRDAAAMTSMFDLVGLPDVAAQNLQFFLSWQQPDGLFISRPGQYDGFGQALWSLGRHVELTRDAAFAQGMLPAVGRAMAWLSDARAHDPLGLLPPSDPHDNELVAGHLTGDNLWGVAGARAAAEIARAAGNQKLADDWSADAAAYQATLDASIRQAVKRTGGWIPPALDKPGGQDWGNLWPVYPTGIYPPSNDAVRATMRHARARFAEGIATYLDGRDLHDYLGFRVFETDLAAGAQERVVDGLYAELAHTTSTHAGFETGVRVYGSRAVDDDMSPHGWFAAEYATLLRNMLVRERPDGIALMSAVSPAWLKPDEAIAVHDAPTAYGPVSFTLRVKDDGARLEWHADVPESTQLHWPLPDWAHDVKVDGLEKDGQTVLLNGRSGTLEVRWRLARPAASYDQTVADLKSAYRRHGR
ncbi:MAG: hypothetical protein ACJ76Z_07615 [Thermoleophilaceae bacterium]